MNTLTGKSIGIALLMAAALLAALFAMGVFAPAGAGASVVETDGKEPTQTLTNSYVLTNGQDQAFDAQE